jgi:hypothetical protein
MGGGGGSKFFKSGEKKEILKTKYKKCLK